MKMKKSICIYSIVTLSFVFFVCTQKQKEKPSVTFSEKKFNLRWDFEDISVGQLPIGWKVEGTKQAGPLATWQVIRDTTVPSGVKGLALTECNHYLRKIYNICWVDTISFLNGEIEVQFKALKGKIDQGGGIIWRAKDKNNYYIARFNPLEDNFRFYYVLDGKRTKLLNKDITLPKGKWTSMKIVQKSSYFEGYLNGIKFLEGVDSTFISPGGIGLWTKADAVTLFDDFICIQQTEMDKNE
jgi:hypothetical protein